jgi:hypothetical protein
MKKYMKYGMIPLSTAFALAIGLTPVVSADSPYVDCEQRLEQVFAEGFITREQADHVLYGEMTLKEMGVTGYHYTHMRNTGMPALDWKHNLEEAVANGLITGEEGVDIQEWL